MGEEDKSTFIQERFDNYNRKVKVVINMGECSTSFISHKMKYDLQYFVES